MTRHKQKLRSLLINAIIDLCRKESFYLEELRIEGTLCVVSDRSSALIMQITEQVGEKTTSDTDPEDNSVQLLMVAADEQSSSAYEDSSKVVSGEVTLGKIDHSVGNWLLAEQPETQNPLLKESIGGKIEGKHQCPFCPKRYRFKHSLKDHINKHTGNRPHHCKYCSLCFMHLGSLCAHVKRRHSQYMLTEYQCRICNERFMSEQFLKQHYTWKHKGEKLTPNEMVTMMMSAVGSQYPTTPTGDQNKAGSMVDDQSKNASGPLMTWNNHVGDVAKTPDWNPGQSSGDLTTETANPSSSSTVVKLEPNFVSPDESLHPRHMAGHGSSSSMQFNAPTVGFQQMAHTLSMFSSFPFTRGCNPLGSFAPFTSSYQPNLVPPSSSVANVGSKVEDGSTLQRSADGKFQCPYCEKSYNFKHTLKDHINKHLGKRPHVCKHCGDSFVHLASLCAHIKRRHDEHMPTEFRCEICHEKLMNYQSLKQHYTWRHREARMFMEANEYSMFLNSVGADASVGGAEKDPTQQMAGNPMFFFPGQSLDGADVTPGESKKQKSDALITPVEFDAVRALDSLLPDEYQLASSAKNMPSAGPDLGHSDAAIDKRDRHSGIFAEPMLQNNETVQQMALMAEYFEEIDVQTPQGVFKYKCRVCGNMLKPQTNLSEHLSSHYAGRKSFAEDTGGVTVAGDANALTCLGCSSKFHGELELQHHLEANPDHLPQPWHQ